PGDIDVRINVTSCPAILPSRIHISGSVGRQRRLALIGASAVVVEPSRGTPLTVICRPRSQENVAVACLPAILPGDVYIPSAIGRYGRLAKQSCSLSHHYLLRRLPSLGTG